MRFKRIGNYDDVELPEKATASLYVNVRSAVRIDVRPGETLDIPTGVRVTVGRNEKAYLEELIDGMVPKQIKSGELFVTVKNKGKRNIMVYPGQALAEIVVKKETKKATAVTKEVRKATFTSEATVRSDTSDAPGFHSKQRDCCP